MQESPLKIWCGVRLNESEKSLLLQRTRGHEVVFADEDSVALLGAQGAATLPADADIAFGQPATDAVLAAEKLRWVQVSSAGYTRYDTQDFRFTAIERGLILSNSSSVFAEPCAQHVLACMLAHTRALPEALADRSEVDSPAWRALRSRSTLLRDDTVLILGYGAIARRIAELLKPFGVRVIATRRRPNGHESLPIVTEDRIHEALAQADHVISTLPANPSTRHYMNRERFAAMKPGSVFHNIGRGTTVDQDALAEALRSGRPAAAWLDVTEPEPLPDDHPLRQLPNCHITPHTGGGHTTETESLVTHFADNLDRLVGGGCLQDRIL